jgi:two-component system sensor histidine kinase YesM
MPEKLKLGNINKEFGILTTQKKLIIYFFTAVIIIFFIFNTIFYRLYSANIEQIVLKESHNTVSKTIEFADIILNSVRNTADIVQGDRSIQEKLSLDLSMPNIYLKEYELITTLQNISYSTEKNISSIDLFLNSTQKFYSTDYGAASNLDPDLIRYYMSLQQKEGSTLSLEYRKRLTFTENRNFEQITFTRPFYSLDTNSIKGLIAINIDMFVFKNLITRDPDSSSFILDESNTTIVSSLSRSQKGMPQELESLKSQMTETSGDLFFNLNGKRQILVYDTSEYSGWKFITVITASESMQQMSQLRDSILVLFLLMSVLSAGILVLLLTEKIYRKVNKLILSMKEVERGNFDVTIRHGDRDEFGFMYTSFNNMTGKIKSLFGELYQQKLLQKDAELKLLQSKINPHFIYNIFDNMNWLIQLERYEELELLVDAVSNYFKKSLNVGRDFITIADTIDQLKSYVEIQKIRFRDRFTCTVEVEEDLMGMQILNFMLQPLVENAICHGIEPVAEKCHISVKGYRSGGNVCFCVEDDGMGIPADRLEEINYYFENEQAKTDDYFAVTNINMRIKLFYGREYGLKIASVLSEGTKVTVTIPAEMPQIAEGTHD